MEQPSDGSEQVRQTDAQPQHGNGHGDQHGIIVPVRLSVHRSLRAVADVKSVAVVVVFVVPRRPVVGPTHLTVFVVRVAGAVVSPFGGAVVGAVVALEHAYLDGVQEPDVLPARRRQVVPAPDQRAAAAPVQHPFRWHVRVADRRRIVGGDYGRRGRQVAATDRFEQHVVQDAHDESRSLVGSTAKIVVSVCFFAAVVALVSDVRSRMNLQSHETGPVGVRFFVICASAVELRAGASTRR